MVYTGCTKEKQQLRGLSPFSVSSQCPLSGRAPARNAVDKALASGTQPRDAYGTKGELLPIKGGRARRLFASEGEITEYGKYCS